MHLLDILTLGMCLLGLGLSPVVYCDNHENSWEVCKMSPEKGECTDWAVRWYYNDTSMLCDRFWYGGCGGNDNKFENQSDCTSFCGSSKKGTENIVITEDDSKTNEKASTSVSAAGACSQPNSQGTCRDFTVKWFYNSSSESCDRFWYGGCDGNDNRFDQEDECKQACISQEDVCKQPSVTGRCRARHIRWYYNSGRRECMQFIYGGCNGNGNRFRSRADCERQCLDATEALGDQNSDCRTSRFGCCPDGRTPSRGNNNEGCRPLPCDRTEFGCCDDDITPAQGPDQEGCELIEFPSGDGNLCNETEYGCCMDGITAAQGPSYRGCPIKLPDTSVPDTDEGDRDGFTVDSGEAPAHCQLAKNAGPCSDYTVMWYYNARSGECERFWYGGCEGNSNRYKTEKECLTICQNTGTRREPEPELPVCEQAKEIGPCRAGLTRWFYNSGTRACEQFIYGGCQGNENNFDDQETCERRCGVPTIVEIPLTAAEICAQPRSVGPCKASIQKFYYNAETRRCEQFTYGGCGGNRNNFDSETRCRQYCRAGPPVVIATESPPRTVAPRTRQPVCELTPALGPCRRMITKHFFNISSGQCETFTYGGCLGNHNNFETQEKCSSYCGLRTGRSRTDDCTMSKQTGPCRGTFRRYYFDSSIGRCLAFAYGGCQGNGNNFLDESSCMATCRDTRVEPLTRPPVTRSPYTRAPVTRAPVTRAPVTRAPVTQDICSLGLQTPCDNRGEGPFWYYEKTSGVCKEIPNGECNSNQNNFRSREACERYCNRNRVCTPLTYETEIRCLAYFEKWTYNPDTNACEMFVYGGCGGSANNFDTEADCLRKCREATEVPATRAPAPSVPEEICAMPEDSGNCLAYIRNWRYDSLTGKCVQFVYGGCGGNENRFQSEQECQYACNRQVVCQRFEEPEIGCLAYLRRWRYDPDSGNCENFIYGGCGGNANNFDSLDACDEKCSARDPEPEPTRATNTGGRSSWRDICRLQADVGPCKQFNKRWHYNSISQSCEEFTYGGCLGNHNNFESENQCLTYCDSSRWARPDPRPNPRTTTETPDVIDESSGEIPTVEPATGVAACALDSYTGRCRGYIRSWYYDSLSGECKQFIYGGCGSNGNRFDSQEECDGQCSPRAVCMLPKSSGSCMAYMSRYYFDYGAQECKQFVYGGCEGNANNFETMDACENRCASLMGDRAPGPTGKTGYCPPKTDWGGLLGACAPTCQDDNSCGGNQKCCHHGCGMKCIDPVAEEPYQMNTPVRVAANTMSSDSVQVSWYDRSLATDQLIRDNRYYTIRYYSFGLGQYEYKNVTELRGVVNGLRSDTEYEFNVRVNDPPYLSEWSENTRNRTLPRVVDKAGQCPVVSSETFGVCVEECQNDADCSSIQKCCSNGCGQTCVNPSGYNVCNLPKDPGSCSDWEVRWYFDTENQRCDRFWFGGCNQGNGNNFAEQTECQRACARIAPTTARPLTARPYDCRRTTFGCCLDRYTPRVDERGTNCAEYEDGDRETDRSQILVPAIPGESVTLDCSYGGDVSWYRNGKLVEANRRRTFNSDGTLVVSETNIEDDGLYACHVRISGGRPTVYSFMLQVRVPIGVLPGPDKIMVKPNRQAFLHCEVYGNPKPTVTWRKGSQSVTSADYRYETFRNGTLLIRSATERDIDSYTCTADNGVTTPVERTIKLELREMLVARIENDNGRVMEGARIKLSCEGRGYPPPTITWEKMGRPLSTGGNVFIGSDNQLTIRNVTRADSGTYTCIVSNTVEKIETATTVQVVQKVMPDDKCVDKTSLMKCRLIVTARLCGYPMYSKICCSSCRRYLNGE